LGYRERIFYLALDKMNFVSWIVRVVNVVLDHRQSPEIPFAIFNSVLPNVIHARVSLLDLLPHPQTVSFNKWRPFDDQTPYSVGWEICNFRKRSRQPST
jgi:hypothetical protein